MVTKTKKEVRPKRTKGSTRTAAERAAKPGADNPLPTADSLALIAANVSKGIDLEPRLAVDYAYKLWQSAREKLEGEMKEPAPDSEDIKIQKSDGGDPAPDLPSELPSANPPARDTQPESPPATPPLPPPKTSLPTFDTFLRTVVKGETVADAEKRFGVFLRSKFSETEADDQMARLRTGGFKDLGSWLEMAREFRDWSKSEKSG